MIDTTGDDDDDIFQLYCAVLDLGCALKGSPDSFEEHTGRASVKGGRRVGLIVYP